MIYPTFHIFLSFQHAHAHISYCFFWVFFFLYNNFWQAVEVCQYSRVIQQVQSLTQKENHRWTFLLGLHITNSFKTGKIWIVFSSFIISDHHHHHVALVARISLTLSRHSSLSFIALGRSSGQHPVSSHSCWMYVRAGRPAFARPCVGVHKSTSLLL